MTYDDKDYRNIARAVGVQFTDLEPHRLRFEAAARWYRLDRNSPKRVPPSQLRRQLDSIVKKARGLLKALGIDDLTSAEDGPADAALLLVLASADGSSEGSVLDATRRVAQLVEHLEAAQGANNLKRLALDAANDVAIVHREIVPPGHRGEAAVNNWIAAMIPICRDITGREPGTSVGGPLSVEEGIAGGPLIRFLMAAGPPLGIDYSSDAWRQRIRTIRKQAALQN